MNDNCEQVTMPTDTIEEEFQVHNPFSVLTDPTSMEDSQCNSAFSSSTHASFTISSINTMSCASSFSFQIPLPLLLII